MEAFMHKILGRLGALIDGSAWMLILPVLLVLWFLDPPAAKTLVQWSAFYLVLAGVVVMISRIVFPMIRMDDWLSEARRGNVAAGAIVAALITFVGLAMLAAVLWARPA